MNIRNILAILLLVSMGLNVWLALYALREPLPAAGQLAREQAAGSMIAALTNDAPRQPQTSANIRNPNFGWQTVESADYREYIANLRAVGCPEETIRDIIRADVKKLYEQKRKEVRRAAPRFEYWKGDDFLRGAA